MSVVLHEPVDADVIVVGAGPAGAAAAFHLARCGIGVLLLDAASFPRDKVCGDFVGPVALRELADLGVTRRPELQRANKVIGASLHLDGERMVTRHLPDAPGLPAFGRVIPRADLDHWIVDAAVGAGADLVERTKIAGIEIGPGSATVIGASEGSPVRLRARVVIAADGSNSKLARLLDRRGDRRGDARTPIAKKDRIVAVRAYYTDVRGPGDRCDMYFSHGSFPGYYWLFPTSATTANVGLGMVMETTPPTDGHLRTMLLDVVERDPALRERLGDATIDGRVLGWPLSTFNHRQRIVGDGLLLAGDAAGLINPLNGEGIQYALLSGRWAATAVVEALRTSGAGTVPAVALEPYSRHVVRELRPEMALATTIVSLIRRRDLNPVWLMALRVICARATTDKQYADLAGGILAGITPASTALSREIVGGTIAQVMRMTVAQGARTVLRPRRQVGSLVDEVTATAGAVVTTTLGDPKASVGWAVDVGRALVELGAQSAAGLARDRGQSGRSTM